MSLGLKFKNTDVSMTRRKALGSFVGLGFLGFNPGLANIIAHSGGWTPLNVPVIEWNAHLFSSDLSKYPIHSNATYIPDLSDRPTDPLMAYLKGLDEDKIDKAVVVQPEPYGDDHRLIVDCVNRSSNRLRGTSLFYPKDPDAPKKLENLVNNVPHIVSIRFHDHRGKETYFDNFTDSGPRALWKKAVDLDLVIELHIGPNYAAQAGKLIKEFKGCKILIDHLAEPHMGSAVEYSDVLDLARYPNVYMKLSGLGHFEKDAPYYESAMSFTSRVIREYGTDRMVWGGGSPKIVDVHMNNYSISDRAKVKGGNIQKLLNCK